jgi:hypothetical protein
MLRKGTRVALLFALVACGSSSILDAVTQPESVSGSRIEGWSIEPVVISEADAGAETLVVWCGFRNGQKRARMMCVANDGYGAGDGDQRLFKAQSVTHACTEQENFTVVLPGQTYYRPLSITLPATRTGATSVNLYISIRSRDVGTARGPDDVQLRWSGTLDGLLKAGRRTLGAK